MLGRNANATIHPPLLRPDEMAELLAALVADEARVAGLVAALAPRNAGAMLEELALLAAGQVPHDAISRALRWILPEIHEELAGAYRAARA
ncbi:MAG TPA: hypothetical protein VFL83_16820 [Anaeromyxobacter sp.]|nr:hypothetical protein [Anaeromyxobacter sp.]